MDGIIYRYKSPSGRFYIGQTTDEKRRRKDFLGPGDYAGPKINRARAKYGPERFEYTVLVRIKADNALDIRTSLNVLEQEYIRQYDSMRRGYNCTPGGEQQSIPRRRCYKKRQRKHNKHI